MGYAYAVRAIDPENDPLTFSLTTAPAGMKINPPTGLVPWTPQTTQVGNQNVAIRVTDGSGGIVGQTYTVTVATSAGNRPPVITSTP